MKRISLPYPLVMRQAAQLFKTEEEQKKFYDALKAGVSREQAIIVLQNKAEIGAFPKLRPTPWQPEFVVRLMDGFKASTHPLYEKGAFYSLDLSSCFAASAMLAIPDPVESVLDVCAAPGGKSIFAYRALSPAKMVCNEVIRKRGVFLQENLDRCKVPAEVVSLDPSALAQRMRDMFGLVIVDAPCSGQSLLAMGKDAHGAFHPNIINMNANRQKRIVANAAQWVNPGGWLAYMTCTFSPDENEGVIQWFLARNPEWRIVPVPHLATHAKEVGYQLYPHQGHGAGGYCCLLRAPF